MQQPTAQIFFYKSLRKYLENNFTVRSRNRIVRGRQFVVVVDTARSRIESASVEVAFRERGTSEESFDELIDPSRALLSSASWGRCSITEDKRVDRITPKRIGETLFGRHEETLKPSLFHLATVFFTLEGHNVGYQTDEETSPIPFGVNYVLQVHVTGENLAVLPMARFMVRLNEWDKIDIRPFSFLDLLTVSYEEWKRSDSRWASFFRRIRSLSHP